MKILVPLYIYPGDAWSAVSESATRVDIAAIVNPNSGPGEAVDHKYKLWIQRLRDAKVQVLGYVATGYGQRHSSQVSADVEKYREWYGVTSIFFDEVCAEPKDLAHYRNLRSCIAGAPESCGNLVFMNPGVDPDAGYFNISNGVVTCENYYKEFMNEPIGRVSDQSVALVHSCPTVKDMLKAFEKAKGAGFGWIYITDDLMDNPWDVLPTYWDDLVEAVVHAPKASRTKKPSFVSRLKALFQRN